jgi:hypothetical protein
LLAERRAEAALEPASEFAWPLSVHAPAELSRLDQQLVAPLVDQLEDGRRIGGRHGASEDSA